MAHLIDLSNEAKGRLQGAHPKRLYGTPAWFKLRARKLRLTPNCEWCGARGPKGHHVDHRRRVRDSPDLALDITNLQTLCGTCHNQAKQRHEHHAGDPMAQGVDPMGNPLDPRHLWNIKR